MRRDFYIAITLFLAAQNILAASSLEEGEACIGRVKGFRTKWVDKLLPGSFLLLDRKLFQMTRAIPQVEKNFQLLEHQKAQSPPVYGIGHLMGNAVVGCEAFYAAYVARTRRLGRLVFSSGSLVLALILWLVFNMIPFADEAHPPDPRTLAARAAQSRDQDRAG